MILTDKAKEDFLLKVYLEEDTNSVSNEEERLNEAFKWLNLQDERFVTALIIEWFDSIGIYVTTLPCIDKTFDSYITVDEKRIEVSQFNTLRVEATEKALEKANEIYNELKK